MNLTYAHVEEIPPFHMVGMSILSFLILMKTIPPRHFAFLFAASLLAFVTGCGGGGGEDDSWLYPLWVPTDVLVADIDGNGQADVITLAQLASSYDDRNGHLVVRLQTSSDVFAPAQTYLVGVYPWKMALGDIDGDGAVDLVIVDPVGSTSTAPKSIWMLRQDIGNRGQFLAPERLAIDTIAPYDVVIGDMSGDDVPDIVVADSLSPLKGAILAVQDADNRGAFLPQTLIALPGNSGTVAMGDVNGDGRSDLAFRMGISSVNYVWTKALGIVYQQPGGVLAPAVTMSTVTGLNTMVLAISDYDNNGLLDVVEAFNPAEEGYPAKVSTLLQDPLDTFSSPLDTSLETVNGRNDGVVEDLNGDGLPDFACVGFYPVGSPSTVYSTLNVFMQDGGGRFGQTAAIALPVATSQMAGGDVNGDGLNDLVALGGDNKAMVLYQSNTVHGTFLAPQFLN